MNNSLLKLLIQPLIIVTITLTVTVAGIAPIAPLPLSHLILDGVISGLLLAILNFLLRELIKYSNYKSLSMTQKIVNYSALAILFVICWVGINFLTLYTIFPADTINYILPTIPIRIILALLTYSVLILLYGYLFTGSLEDDGTIETDTESTTNTEPSEKTIPNGDTPDNETLEHIAVKNGQKIDLIFINDIISIQAEGNYVMIFTPKGKYLKEQTMKYFGDHLPANKFVRVHRSSIINIDYIQRIELYEKQSQMLKLQNNLQVKMSIAGYKELKKILNL